MVKNYTGNRLVLISIVLTIFLGLLSCGTDGDSTINEVIDDKIKSPPMLKEAVEIYEPLVFENGYTLIAPLTSKNTYLIDMEGYVVHKWESEYTPNNSVYLLEDGSLLRTEKINSNTVFSGRGGSGGRIARYGFEGKLEWAWAYSSDDFSQHHDIELLPNGNILVIAWEIKTMDEALKAGKNTGHVNDMGVWPEHIIEIEPVGSSGANIVWEWHQWDHMVQDFDATKANFGKVSEHPELIDINFEQSLDMDITHFNGIEYVQEHDLIIVSAHRYSELWVIDHGTTIKEAASHTGGKKGKGGDLLYRYGNTLAYKVGDSLSRKSFLQHDPVWLTESESNGGNLIFFNNGDQKADRPFSTVDEIRLPIDNLGDFETLSDTSDDLSILEWRFEADDFYSRIISGAQRLKNGNTLICEGFKGLLHEVTVDKKTVWKYNLPTREKSIFRAYRYPNDFPAFFGKEIKRLEIDIE